MSDQKIVIDVTDVGSSTISDIQMRLEPAFGVATEGGWRVYAALRVLFGCLDDVTTADRTDPQTCSVDPECLWQRAWKAAPDGEEQRFVYEERRKAIAYMKRIASERNQEKKKSTKKGR